MSETQQNTAFSPKSLLVLIAFLVICQLTGFLGSLATQTSVETWYQGLAKPPFNPPDGIFAPVWITLYVLMGVAAWRIWLVGNPAYRGFILTVFLLHLVLNLGWSLIFFGAQMPGLALLEILALEAFVIGLTIMFWAQDKFAGLLMLPYMLWGAFAVVLNASIWWLN